jgi:hypothetical protein
MTRPTTHPTLRATLFSSIFFTVLPSHYTTMLTRWTKIAHLHFSAKNKNIPMERAGAVNSLKAELEMYFTLAPLSLNPKNEILVIRVLTR